MELERRVKTLEQEMKILKNQIQTTLRDIQEQVLMHYYPSLRSDGEEVLTSTTDQEIPKETNSAEEDQGSMAPLPKVQMVSLNDIRRKKSPSSFFSEEKNTSSETTQQRVGTGFAELAYWMADSVVEIGIARTKKLITMRALDETFTFEAQEKLLQLLAMFDEDDRDREVLQEMVEAFLRLNKLSD